MGFGTFAGRQTGGYASAEISRGEWRVEWQVGDMHRQDVNKGREHVNNGREHVNNGREHTKMAMAACSKAC